MHDSRLGCLPLCLGSGERGGCAGPLPSSSPGPGRAVGNAIDCCVISQTPCTYSVIKMQEDEVKSYGFIVKRTILHVFEHAQVGLYVKFRMYDKIAENCASIAWFGRPMAPIFVTWEYNGQTSLSSSRAWERRGLYCRMNYDPQRLRGSVGRLKVLVCAQIRAVMFKIVRNENGTQIN